MICQAITLTGRQCQRGATNGNYCYQHYNQTSGYRELKPKECIICYESLENQNQALECGHWIHLNCIINSAKAMCPICRRPLLLGKRAMKTIDELAYQREEELLREEEQALQMEFGIDYLLPALEHHIYGVVGGLIAEDDLDYESDFSEEVS